MNSVEIKSQIKQHLIMIQSLKLSKLFSNSTNVVLWDNTTPEDVNKFVNSIKISLVKIIKRPKILDDLAYNQLNNFYNRLVQFINSVTELNKLDDSKITSHHHKALNYLREIANILRNSGIYSITKITPEIEDKMAILEESLPSAYKLIEEKNDIEEALKLAKEWIEAKGQILNTTIKGQAIAFKKRAESHATFNKKGKKSGLKSKHWFISMLIFSLVTMFLVALFIYELTRNGGDVSTGNAILRVSSLVVPIYLITFSANQHSYHKKMYESLMFKYASLETMNSLIKLNEGDPSLKKSILEKGLNILFSEPTIKEDSVKKNQLVDEIIKNINS